MGDGGADFCIWRQNQQAGRVFAEAEFDRAAEHSFRFDTTQFGFSNLSSIRQLYSRQRQRNLVADFVIGRAANDLAFRAAAVVHFTNCEPISIRMARRRGDLRNDHLVDLRPARLDVFGFNASAGQQFRDLVRIFWEIDEFAQPINGEFHFVSMSYRAKSRHLSTIASRDSSTPPGMTKRAHANWRRKRKSFCAKSRISGMSNRIIARRSMPRPNA